MKEIKEYLNESSSFDAEMGDYEPRKRYWNKKQAEKAYNQMLNAFKNMDIKNILDLMFKIIDYKNLENLYDEMKNTNLIK